MEPRRQRFIPSIGCVLALVLLPLTNGWSASTNAATPPEILTTFQNTPLTFLTEKLLTNDSPAIGTNTSLLVFSMSSTSLQGGVVSFITDGAVRTNSSTNNAPFGLFLNAFALDPSDNLLLAVGDDDFVTIKRRSDGTPLWTNRYNGPANSFDRPVAIAVDPGGNVCVTGSSANTPSGGDTGFATVKYLADGTPVWTNRFNGPTDADHPTGVAFDRAGNVYVAGYVGLLSTNRDFVLIKYSADGTALWTNLFGSESSSDIPTGLVVDSNDDVYVTGSSEGFGVTIKYRTNGIVWLNRFPGSPTALQVDLYTNLYVVGSGRSGTNNDYVVIKYLPSGAAAWTNRYRGPSGWLNTAAAVAVDRSGNVYVTGSASAGARFDLDFGTIKYSADGIPLWTNRYSGPGADSDQPVAIAVDSKGNVFVTGGSNFEGSNLGSDRDITTVKYFADGQAAWTNRHASPGDYPDRAVGIAVDKTGNVYVGGTVRPFGSFEYVVVKYSSGTEATYTPPSNFTGTDSFDYVVREGGGVLKGRIAKVAVLPREPVLIEQPVSQSARRGGAVLLSAAANGLGPFGYQWRFGGADLAGATNETFLIDPLTSGRAGNYSVLVSGAAGSVTSAIATVFFFDLASFANQTASLLFAGPTGARFQLESSETLTNWESVALITLTNSPQLYRDSRPSNLGQRFYRAALQP